MLAFVLCMSFMNCGKKSEKPIAKTNFSTEESKRIIINYNNGKPFLIGEKIGFHKVGIWKEFDILGNLASEENYDNNILTSFKSFYDNGNVKRSIMYSSREEQEYEYTISGIKTFSSVSEKLNNQEFALRTVDKYFKDGLLVKEHTYYDEDSDWTTRVFHMNGKLHRYYQLNEYEDYKFIQVFDSLGNQLLDYNEN